MKQKIHENWNDFNVLNIVLASSYLFCFEIMFVFDWSPILHYRMWNLMNLLVVLCSSSSLLCTSSSISSTFLHGARPSGDWFHRWSWFQDNTCSRRLRCQAIASTEGKCEESNVLLLRLWISLSMVDAWMGMEKSYSAWSKHRHTLQYFNISLIVTCTLVTLQHSCKVSHNRSMIKVLEA